MQLAQQGIILSFVDRRPAILSVDAVTDISVSFNTEFFEVVFRLPIQVMVNTSDGNSELMTVTWNEGSYNEAVAGVYTILGTITPSSGVRNPLGITAEVDVTV